jgi:hypothetical protein
MSFIHGVVTVPLKVRIRAGATTPKVQKPGYSTNSSAQRQGDLSQQNTTSKWQLKPINVPGVKAVPWNLCFKGFPL